MKSPVSASRHSVGRTASLLAAVTALLASGSQAQAASPNRFAVVDLNGGLVSGNGVSGVTHLGTGQYEVTFTSGVASCAYVASPVNAYSQALTAFTAGGHLSPQGVYVETKNQGGGLTDGPFHLVVTCGGTGRAYAVVGYAADLVRSSPNVTLNAQGAGRYQVRFPRSVAKCAYLATVGDPGAELVYNPSGVYTGSGPDSRTVYVETKNPGGGLQDGVPFHLAVFCPSAPDTRVEVVRTDGIYQRGTAVSFRGAPGHYTVVSERSLAGCATVGTRGSVDQAVPFSPATLEVVPGPAPNTVGIEVRNLLFFGGAFLDEAFHTAVVCAGANP